MLRSPVLVDGVGPILAALLVRARAGTSLIEILAAGLAIATDPLWPPSPDRRSVS